MAALTDHNGKKLLNKAAGSVIALLVVIGVSAAGWGFHLNLAAASVLDVVLVVLLARRWGFVTATVASFACLLCLDFFFIPSAFTGAIADSRNWVTLAAFELAALVVSRLALEAEGQARLAKTKREESERLYEVSRNLLLLDRRKPVGSQIVELLSRVCRPEAVAMFDADLAKMEIAGEADSLLESRTRESYLTDRNLEDEDGTLRVQVLRFGVRAKGALGLRGPMVTESLMNGLSTMAAIGLETQRSFESESRAIAEHHGEQLRTAVLDALAHDFKTPLTTIQACSGGLLEATSLSEGQRELANLIQEEAERLNQLTNRLLRTARIDSKSVVLRRLPVELHEIVQRLVATGNRSGREITLYIQGHGASVQVDADLLALALSQLLDNAIRYSSPNTPIAVKANARESEVVLSVTNTGQPIPAAERNRIFERYYRAGGAGNQIGGSGLGLSVTKKIVEAHSGRVWVESDDLKTAFFVSIPRFSGVIHE